jgi:ferredoxin/flavodoxin
MNNKPIHSVFFSPTGTTHTVVQAVCRGTGQGSGLEIDLKEPVGGQLFFATDDPVVIGMPVYAGRLPRLAVERFAAVKGSETPAIAVVVYGNRAYDDALLELCDLCTAQGFKVTGAATFVGKHSFSSADFPIAANRPDEKDIRQAEQFGSQFISGKPLLDINKIPGNRPYKPEMKPAGAATDSNPETCIRCGQCVAHCPANAIRISEGLPLTDPALCIWCIACVRNCPTGARTITLPKIHEIAERLYQTCQTRKEPEWFLAQQGESK